MKSYDKTLTRLILILTKLSNDERPSLEELSSEFNVGLRTIQRDIYERLAYFPIEKNLKKELKFIDGFSLDRSTLENDEILLVYLALNQVKGISKNFELKIDNVFAKLLTPDYKTPYHIKTQSFQEIDPYSKLFKNIEFAIENAYYCIISFEKKDILIQPYKIVCFSGLWYLLAKNEKDRKIKSYLIHEIKKITLLNKKYEVDIEIDEILSNVHSAWFDDGKSFLIKVLVQEEISYFFKLKNVFPSQKILEEDSHGNLIITFEVSHYEDIDNIIKAWLPHIQVLEPIEYQEKIKEELKSYLNNLNLQKDYTLE